MTLPVFVSRRAKLDISKILTWIDDRSSSGADKWLTTLENAINDLPRDPTSNALAPEAVDLGIDLRQRLFKTRRGNTYRLLFVLRLDAIHVLAVRGTGQDLLSSDEIEAVD